MARRRKQEAPMYLWEDLADDDPLISEAAKNELARYYMPLIEGIARKLKSKLPTFITDDDLMSSASLGFVRAMYKYTPESDRPFSNYASVVIWGAVIDGLRAVDFAPKGLRKQEREMNEAIKSLQEEGMHVITDEDISDRMEISLEALQTLQKKIIRADVKAFDPQTIPVRGTENVEDQSSMLMRVFCSWLQEKSDLTQKVILMKYWRGDTYRIISDVLEIPMSDVRRIESEVLDEVIPLMKRVVAE